MSVGPVMSIHAESGTVVKSPMFGASCVAMVRGVGGSGLGTARSQAVVLTVSWDAAMKWHECMIEFRIDVPRYSGSRAIGLCRVLPMLPGDCATCLSGCLAPETTL